MQTVFDYNQFHRISKNNTLEKIKTFSLCPKNKTVKTENFSHFMP